MGYELWATSCGLRCWSGGSPDQSDVGGEKFVYLFTSHGARVPWNLFAEEFSWILEWGYCSLVRTTLLQCQTTSNDGPA